MQSILANVSSSSLNTVSYTATARLCYLLAEKTLHGGNMIDMIDMEKIMRGFNMEQKFMIIADERENSGQGEKDKFDFEEFMRTQKILRKVKHPPREQIILMKKLESSLNALYDKVVKARVRQMEPTGLIGLRPLTDMDEVIQFYYFQLEKPEVEEENWYKSSEIFRKILRPEDAPSPTLIALTPDINTKLFLKERQIYYANEKEARRKDTPWLEGCFTIPNILYPTIADLTVIKKQLSEPILTVRKKIDEWILQIDNGTDEESTLKFFRKDVQPAFKMLQQAIDTNTMFNDYKNTINYRPFDLKVYLGEMPVSFLWEYWHFFKVMSDQTYEILQKEAGKFNRRWPVMMVLHDSVKQKEDEHVMGKVEAPPLKKYLDI